MQEPYPCHSELAKKRNEERDTDVNQYAVEYCDCCHRLAASPDDGGQSHIDRRNPCHGDRGQLSEETPEKRSADKRYKFAKYVGEQSYCT